MNNLYWSVIINELIVGVIHFSCNDCLNRRKIRKSRVQILKKTLFSCQKLVKENEIIFIRKILLICQVFIEQKKNLEYMEKQEVFFSLPLK